MYLFNLVLSILNYFNLNYSFIESMFLAEIYLFPKGVNNMKQFIKRIIFFFKYSRGSSKRSRIPG